MNVDCPVDLGPGLVSCGQTRVFIWPSGLFKRISAYIHRSSNVSSMYETALYLSCYPLCHFPATKTQLEVRVSHVVITIIHTRTQKRE
ncbi:hypothetical protein AG1IA_04297 [Rhizoctonia solani AG-1 IA]|uniref:Uncharacterized protein n=1 Tax=Thanatephorus cucumeris (strain AG1-IA) TaxID=983506 RepID=L8WZ79_THACA|nr:hypothetical protein AG1IA_04297 [Rhizoctonia solani AG-1 IA]